MTRYWWDRPIQHPNMYIVRVKDAIARNGRQSYVVVANNADDAVWMMQQREHEVIGKAEKVKRAVGEMVGVRGIVK